MGAWHWLHVQMPRVYSIGGEEMSHAPELLRVMEQDEVHKTFRCVRLEDSNGVVALVADEKYGDRIAALWNMAERLGLSTEEIDGRKIDHALYKLEELELMVERSDLK